MSVNLGRVAYVEKGAYDVGTVYQKKDVVLFNNGSYVYINDGMSAGKTPTDTAYWQAMLDPTDMNAATDRANSAAASAEAASASIQSDLASKADKAYMVALFEELKALILSGDTESAVALLDHAILDNAVLA